MIAIHNGKGGFHPSWIEYCDRNKIPYKLVNCYDNDLINSLKDCKALFWHHSQNDPKALTCAKSILFALEHAGIIVFPDFRTNWHFDNKLGQKYLFESLEIPFVKTWVFYEKSCALNWAKSTIFPKVFKLKGGAGSSNVRLIKNISEAKQVINISFGKGFRNFNGWDHLIESYRKYKQGQANYFTLLKSFFRIFFRPDYDKVLGREKNYVYFQEFISNNEYDIRVIVIDNKAFAIKRLVRKNDFRASGSGMILYDKEEINKECVKLSFQINNKIKSQCLALDFVFDNDIPLVVEVSYGFVKEGYDKCMGYWDSNLHWHEGKFNPYGWMLESFS